MNLLYVAHPYEGKKENAEAVQKSLKIWQHGSTRYLQKNVQRIRFTFMPLAKY